MGWVLQLYLNLRYHNHIGWWLLLHKLLTFPILPYIGKYGKVVVGCRVNLFGCSVNFVLKPVKIWREILLQANLWWFVHRLLLLYYEAYRWFPSRKLVLEVHLKHFCLQSRAFHIDSPNANKNILVVQVLEPLLYSWPVHCLVHRPCSQVQNCSLRFFCILQRRYYSC